MSKEAPDFCCLPPAEKLQNFFSVFLQFHIGVDSVLAPGHVAQMAAWIQAETGGDLFSIVTAAPYSSDYDECLDRAADEKAANARPALTGTVANMADYDVIFLG